MANVFRVIVIVFCITWILKQVIIPIGVAAFYYPTYQALAVACDTAMDDSWFYRKEVLGKSEKIQLLACHDYDKTRKIMLTAGVPEPFLAYLGLKALELYQRPAEEFVREHRFRER
jgi:His-Xaa-Ser system protein (TIGR03982 family)